MRAILALAVGFWPCLSLAQDWATRAYCDVDLRPVTAEDFAPAVLTELEEQAADIPNGSGRFWQVEASNGATSYLWGTYHVSTPEILALPETVKTTIATSRLIAVEIDFRFADRQSLLDRFDTPGRYRDPSDPFALQDPLDLGFLGPDAEGWVYDRLAGYGVSEDELFVLTYAGLAEILLADPCEDFTSGVIPVQDDYILTLGHIAGVPILGLEAASEFLSDLAEDEDTAKAITLVYASYLEPSNNQNARIASLQLYLEGRLGVLSAWDAATLFRLHGENGLTALQRTDSYLIDVRNRRFMERLLSPLATGGVFIAVGAAHLPGENGLIALLEREGFEVSRIVLEGEVE